MIDAFAPTASDEALEIRASRPEAVPIAGGTDLMVEVNARRLGPAAFLGLSRADASKPVPDVPSRHSVPDHGLGQPELVKAR